MKTHAGALIVATSGLVFSVAVALVFQGLGWGVPAQVLALSVGVVGVAARYGLYPGVAASVFAVLNFNFFFTTPFYSLLDDDPRNFLVFVLLLVLGSVVGSLTDTLAARTRQAQRALLLKGLSHDWRTPLAVMAGTAATVAATADQRLDPTEKDRLAVIEREARDLARQVETILLLVELDEVKLTKVWVPAEELLHSTRDRFAQWYPERSLRLEPTQGMPLVKVDPQLVERALLNLVENAHRASPLEAPIDLVVAASIRSVEFQVFDHGPGVPPGERQRIFAPFVKGRAEPRGTGLGLSLVKQTAQLHGGETGVRDRVGGGSVFWLRLPVPDGAPSLEVS